MYKTKPSVEPGEAFDWTQYFLNRESSVGDVKEKNAVEIPVIRQQLAENHFQFTMKMTSMLRNLLREYQGLNNPHVLELGAATGFLCRWLLNEYGGRGVLVDNNATSKEVFEQLKATEHFDIQYHLQDLFKLELKPVYDIVCSFGLIEHFTDKREILAKHAQFLKPGGLIILLVPMDTPLNRVYWEVYPELNQGYRELLDSNDFSKMFDNTDLELISMSHSFGYVYDVLAGVAVRK